MAWIKVLGEDDVSDGQPELAALFDQVRDPRSGALDNIMSIHSLHPAGLRAHFDLYSSAMRPTRSLRKADREMIAVVVSRINDCHY